MSDQPQDNKQSQSDFARRLGAFAWICVAIILLWSLSWMFIDASIVSDELRGQFGDKFGAINSLFSGLAFATLIYALFLQMEELRIQRKELELTRNEMRGQKEEFSDQNKTLKQQRFENTFFHLMQMYDETLSYLKSESHRYIPTPQGDSNIEFYTIEGKDVLKEVVRECNKNVLDSIRDETVTLRQAVSSAGNSVVQFEEMYCYFNFVNAVFEFIDSSDVVDKEFYYGVLCTKFSGDDLILLYYKGLSDEGETFRYYLEKYSLLKGFPIAGIVSVPLSLNFYSPSAYGRDVYW